MHEALRIWSLKQTQASCEPKVSGLEQYNNYRLTLVTGRYCSLLSNAFGVYTATSAFSTAGSISEFPSSDAVQYLCDSVWFSAIPSNLHPFISGFISLGRGKNHKGKEISVIWASSCMCLHKVGLISGRHSADEEQILQQCTFVFKTLVKMHRDLLCDRPRLI